MLGGPLKNSDGALILYVDYDRNNRLVFRCNFQNEFGKIQCVATAKEATPLLATKSIGVLVVSTGPRESNLETLRTFRKERPDIERVAVAIQPPQMRQLLVSGLLNACVPKPWNREELGTVLRQSWRHFRRNRLREEGQVLISEKEVSANGCEPVQVGGGSMKHGAVRFSFSAS